MFSTNKIHILVIMQSVYILFTVMLNLIMLSVMAPTQRQLESVQWIVARLSVIMPTVTAHKSVNDEEKKVL